MDVARMVLSGMWLQDPDSLSSGNSRLLMIFVAMVAIAMVAQAVALIVMAIGAAKARKQGIDMLREVRDKSMPLINGAQEMIRDAAPKVKVITENFVETSHVVRAKAQQFDATLSDVNRTVVDMNRKTQAQVSRVDGIVSSALNTTSEISESIQRGIKIPVREVTGLVNGLKAGLDVLVGRAKGFGIGRADVPRDRDRGW
jgi:hypothetical protein